MNGSKLLFFNVRNGEMISPFNIWKRQKAFVRVLSKIFEKFFLGKIIEGHGVFSVPL